MSSSIQSHPESPRLADTLRFMARLAFAVTIILIPFRWRIVHLARPNPPIYGDYIDFLLFAVDIAMLVMLVMWGISLLVHPRKIKFGPMHIWIPLLGLTFAGWFSLAGSWDAPLTVYHAVRFIFLFLYFLFIVNEIRSPAWVVAPVALQVLIQSIVVIGQSLLQRDLRLQSLGEYKLDPIWQGISILEADGVRFLRAYGLSDHPNILGGCLAFGLLILLVAYVYADGRDGCRWEIKVFVSIHERHLKAASSVPRAEMEISIPCRLGMLAIALVFILASVALLLTFSRSAWIAFTAGSLFIVGIEAGSRNIAALKRVSVLAVACLLAMSPFIARDMPFLGARLNAGDSFSENRVERGSIIERAYLFDSANKIFVDHALTGVGLGVSVVAMKDVYPVFSVNYQPPHFTLLAAALETGIFGATFYFSLLALPIFIFLSRKRTLKSNPLAIASFALLIAVAIVGFFDYYTWLLVPGRLWQWLGWGIWCVSLDNYDMD